MDSSDLKALLKQVQGGQIDLDPSATKSAAGCGFEGGLNPLNCCHSIFLPRKATRRHKGMVRTVRCRRQSSAFMMLEFTMVSNYWILSLGLKRTVSSKSRSGPLQPPLTTISRWPWEALLKQASSQRRTWPLQSAWLSISKMPFPV